MIIQFDTAENGIGKILTLRSHAKPKVDTSAHVIRDMAVIQSVEALGHGMLIDGTTLQQVAHFGNLQKSGVKSRYTHPGLSSDGLGRHLGRMHNFRVGGDKVLADLHFSESASSSPEGDLREYVEQLAVEDPEAAGMSIVAYMEAAWKLDDGTEVIISRWSERPKNATTEYPFARLLQRKLKGGEIMNPLRAVDLVDEPAANRDGMFSSNTTNGLAAQAFGALDKWRSEKGNAADPMQAAMEWAEQFGMDDEGKVRGFIDAHAAWRSFSTKQFTAPVAGISKQKKPMETPEQNTPAPKTFSEADLQAALAAELTKRDEADKLAKKAEKERAIAITALGKEHGFAEEANEAIAEDWTVADFTEKVLWLTAKKLADAEKQIEKLTKECGKPVPRAALTGSPEGNVSEIDSLLEQLNATRDSKERYRITKKLMAARQAS